MAAQGKKTRNTLHSLAGRADLLRFLVQCEQANNAPPNEAKIAPLLGYKRLVEKKPASVSTTITQQLTENAPKQAPEKPSPSKQQRPSEVFYYLSDYQQNTEQDNSDPEQQLPECIRYIDPISDDELKQWSSQAQHTDPEHPLTPKRRLRPFLYRRLSRLQTQQIDMKKLVKKVSNCEPLDDLPRSQRRVFSGRVCVLVDFNAALKPFWLDFRKLLQQIIQQHGTVGLEIRELWGEPDAGYRSSAELNQGDLQDDEQPWQNPDAQTILLIISDLGQLNPQATATQFKWQIMGQHFCRMGKKPLVLAPLAACQIEPHLRAWYSIVPWNQRDSLHPVQSVFDRQMCYHDLQQQLDQLLVLLSPALYIETPLLRRIATLLTKNTATSSLQAMLWQHEHVIANVRECAIQWQARQQYQQRFAKLNIGLQKKVLLIIKQFHQHHFPTVWASEIIQASALYQGDISTLGDITAAQAVMNRVARTYYEQPDHQGLSHVAQKELQRQNKVTRKANDYNSVLLALWQREALLQGKAVLAGCDPQVIQQVIGAMEGQAKALESYRLQQQGQYLSFVALYDKPSLSRQYGRQLASLTLNHPVVVVSRGEESATIPVSSLTMPDTETKALLLLRSELPHPFLIDTGTEQLRFSPLQKTTEQQTIGIDQKGVYQCFVHEQCEYRAYWQEPTANGVGSWDNLVNLGQDRYGVYADLVVLGITQRFRWIEPTTFVMGSPEDEVGRYSYETQHQVTLTQGYWLADTTVTQAFWQVVMGENPSYFTAEKTGLPSTEQHPVEQVSWDDCQWFISTLKQKFPALNARLPSEAEWENACRAGTQTSFNFAGKVDLTKVNYSGVFRKKDGGDWHKDALKQTATVKNYPCNAWGLYEMHGNVWEWCQDFWTDDLDADVATYLVAEKKGTNRVLRGGSLSNLGRNVRSAMRLDQSPTMRFYRTGLRLVLGQPSYSQPSTASIIEQPRHQGGQARARAATVSTEAGDAELDKKT